MQDWSRLPVLWLHPLHKVVDGAGPTALRPPGRQEAPTCIETLVDAARNAVKSYEDMVVQVQKQEASKHKILVSCSGLLINALDHDRGGPWEISLRYSEVAHFQTIANILVIGLRESGDEQVLVPFTGPYSAVWVIGIGSTAECSAVDLTNVLNAMSSLGAVRSDFATKYEIAEKPIGTGGCSTVHLGRPVSAKAARDGGTSDDADDFLAVKILTLTEGKDMAQVAVAEVDFLMDVQRHPNIIAFHGLFKCQLPIGHGPLQWILVMEYCAFGDLHDDLMKKGPCDETRAGEIIGGLLSALAHVHAQGIVHRDVKCENILLSEHGRPVLSDFGIAARLDDPVAMAKRCGSPGYSAPEVLNPERYDAKVDVFSAGVVLYFILSCQLPFSGPDVGSVLRRTLRCRVKLDSSHFGNVSLQMKSIIMTLLNKEPAGRPSSATAFNLVLQSCDLKHRSVQRLNSTFTSNSTAPSTFLAEVKGQRKLVGTQVSANADPPMGEQLSAGSKSPDSDIEERERISKGTFASSRAESWRSTGFSVDSDYDPEVPRLSFGEVPTSGGKSPMVAMPPHILAYAMRADPGTQFEKCERSEPDEGAGPPERLSQKTPSTSGTRVPKPPGTPESMSTVWSRRLRQYKANQAALPNRQDCPQDEAAGPEVLELPAPAVDVRVASPGVASQHSPAPPAVGTARARRYRFATQDDKTNDKSNSRRVFAPLFKMSSSQKERQTSKTSVKGDAMRRKPSKGASSSEEATLPKAVVPELPTGEDQAVMAAEADAWAWNDVEPRRWESWCSNASGRSTFRRSYTSERRSGSNAGTEEERWSRKSFKKRLEDEDRHTFTKVGDAILEERVSTFEDLSMLEELPADGVTLEGDVLAELPCPVPAEPEKTRSFLRGMLGWRPRGGIGAAASNSNSSSSSIYVKTVKKPKSTLGERATFSCSSSEFSQEEMRSVGRSMKRSTSQEPQGGIRDD